MKETIAQYRKKLEITITIMIFFGVAFQALQAFYIPGSEEGVFVFISLLVALYVTTLGFVYLTPNNFDEVLTRRFDKVLSLNLILVGFGLLIAVLDFNPDSSFRQTPIISKAIVPVATVIYGLIFLIPLGNFVFGLSQVLKQFKKD